MPEPDNPGIQHDLHGVQTQSQTDTKQVNRFYIIQNRFYSLQNRFLLLSNPVLPLSNLVFYRLLICYFDRPYEFYRHLNRFYGLQTWHICKKIVFL